MEKVLAYKINHDQQLICETLKGQISIDELIVYEKSKLNDSEYNYLYEVLVDIRGGQFGFTNDEKSAFYETLSAISEQVNMKRKCAFITDTPEEVVNAELFAMRMQKIAPMSFRAFTTEEAAIIWLKDRLS